MNKPFAFALIIALAVVSVSAQTGRNSGRYVGRKAGVVRVGPPTTYLKEGLSTDEVLRLLGKPVTVSERDENGASFATLEFQRGQTRVLIAEFVNDALVHTRIETRAQIAQVR